MEPCIYKLCWRGVITVLILQNLYSEFYFSHFHALGLLLLQLSGSVATHVISILQIAVAGSIFC